MEKNSVSSAVVKSIVLVALGAIIILGVYLLLNRGKKSGGEEVYVLTVVDEITTTNLDKNYPADARKVVDLYARTMKVLYKEKYSDEQQTKMLDVLAGIMDDELLAAQSNFYKSMRDEIKGKKDEDYSIPAYVVQSKEPEVVTVDGKKMCTVKCLFSLRHGTVSSATYYEFIMRQDDQGKWKILGWNILEDESAF